MVWCFPITVLIFFSVSFSFFSCFVLFLLYFEFRIYYFGQFLISDLSSGVKFPSQERFAGSITSYSDFFIVLCFPLTVWVTVFFLNSDPNVSSCVIGAVLRAIWSQKDNSLTRWNRNILCCLFFVLIYRVAFSSFDFRFLILFDSDYLCFSFLFSVCLRFYGRIRLNFLVLGFMVGALVSAPSVIGASLRLIWSQKLSSLTGGPSISSPCIWSPQRLVRPRS